MSLDDERWHFPDLRFMYLSERVFGTTPSQPMPSKFRWMPGVTSLPDPEARLNACLDSMELQMMGIKP